MARRPKLPRSCPINFDFNVHNVECKLCRYFDACLRVFRAAERLSRGV